MLWLGLDVETTGLEDDAEVTEIGAVLWDAHSRQPVDMYNKLIQVEKPLTEEITELTGLTDNMLMKYGDEFKNAIIPLWELEEKADFIMAHNAPFDKARMEFMCDKYACARLNKPWIDTCTDVEWTHKSGTRKLVHIAAEHGFVNPFAHRAVFDVLTMLVCAGEYDPENIVMRSKAPTLEVRAVVTFKNKDKAKAKGFRWNGEDKIWVRNIKDFELEKVRNECDFKVEINGS